MDDQNQNPNPGMPSDDQGGQAPAGDQGGMPQGDQGGNDQGGMNQGGGM